MNLERFKKSGYTGNPVATATTKLKNFERNRICGRSLKTNSVADSLKGESSERIEVSRFKDSSSTAHMPDPLTQACLLLINLVVGCLPK
jgi:hypothetical protein